MGRPQSDTRPLTVARGPLGASFAANLWRARSGEPAGRRNKDPARQWGPQNEGRVSGSPGWPTVGLFRARGGASESVLHGANLGQAPSFGKANVGGVPPSSKSCRQEASEFRREAGRRAIRPRRCAKMGPARAKVTGNCGTLMRPRAARANWRRHAESACDIAIWKGGQRGGDKLALAV